MTLQEINETVDEFELFSAKCVAYSEAVYEEYLNNISEASLKIMKESGDNDDMEILLEAAEEGALTKIKNAILKIIEAAKTAIKNLGAKISSFFKGKDIDKAQEIAKGKAGKVKVKVPNYKEAESAINEFDSSISKEFAKLKAGKEPDMDACKKAQEKYNERMKRVKTGSILIPIAAAIGIAVGFKKIDEGYKRTEENFKDLQRIAEETGATDIINKPYKGRMDYAVDMARMKTSLAVEKVANRCRFIQALQRALHGVSPKAKEVDVNYEDIKKNKLKNESVSLDEELIDILIESVDSDVKYGNTEKINKTREYLESMEDYLFGDHTAEIMLESIEEDLGIL